MNKIKAYIGFLAIAVLVFAACSNPFEPPAKPVNNGSGNSGLVRIYIGENNPSSRTVQPGHDALAGYRLTFDPFLEPVDITEGANSAEIFLADGTWTITATAYKLDGEIGNADDAVATGSIAITLSDGEVSGTIPPIILQSITDTGEGTLRYAITVTQSITSGYMKLWEIDGNTPVETFDDDGALDFTGSVSDDLTLAAGRYIAEVKLTKANGDVAFIREVVEIWTDTTTAFVFSSAEFMDPSAVLANSGAILSETRTTFGGIAIGSGTGSGSEADPKTYTIGAPDISNMPIRLFFEEPDSRFATYHWAATSGATPNAYSTGLLPVDFSTNHTLWIEAVSEDGSTTRYYKFMIVLPPPYNGFFKDTDSAAGYIAGTIQWSTPSNKEGIYSYRIYLGIDETTKQSTSPLHTTTSAYAESYELSRMALPGNAKYFLIYSRSETSDYPVCLAIPIVDVTMADTIMGGFKVSGTNSSGISVETSNEVEYLTITQSGTYYISEYVTNPQEVDRIRVRGSNITVNIVLTDVKISTWGTSGTSSYGNPGTTVAFDTNQDNNEGVTVNLTLRGTNTFYSGTFRAGLRVPSNAALVIDGTGSLGATGGNGGAGIGGSNWYNEAVGSITINSGTVTATGGYGNSGNFALSGYTYSYTRSGSTGINGSTISIIGGTVTATGSNGISTGGSSGDGGTGINGSTVSIIGGTVTATGGQSYYNGAMGINGSTVSIMGGTVTATGSSGNNGGTGINGDTINIIDGTVIATGGSGSGTGDWANVIYSGRGIRGDTVSIIDSTVTATGGNHYNGNYYTYAGQGIYGSTVSIKGGTVTATGGTGYNSGSGIESNMISIENCVVTANGGSGNGNGISGDYNATLTVQNNAVVIASSFSPAVPSGWNSIVFNGNSGTMYGNVTIAQDATFPADSQLIIRNGQILTIQGGYTLTNNGTIYVEDGDVVGTVVGNQPVPAFTISGGTGFTYSSGALTITGSGTYTIGMSPGVTSTTNRIVIASGVNANITLSGVNIDMSGRNDTSAFDMTGATVNLTLDGDNILKSGENRAGLQAPSGSTLVITEQSTGSLAATGGSYGAGIGGGSGSAGGTITISGGTVTASSISGNAITAITGNAVVIASSIQPALPTGGNLGPAIVFNGNDGIMYGDVTLGRNVTIPAGRTLHISNSQTLTIQSGYILTNNGTIIIYDGGDIQGTITGSQPVQSALMISGDSAYTYTGGVLTIGNGTYAISMRDGTTSATIDRIVVTSGVNADITLSDVNIDVSWGEFYNNETCAFDMTGATVNLTLVGENVLKSGANRAGLQAPDGATLVITGASTGSLTVVGRSYGAGIGGGGGGGAGGTITISGGTVTATGQWGAGIGGGGGGGAGGTITISGGTVTATGNGNGAGIGGGSGGGAGGTITITGGTVTATGGNGGAGIGGSSGGAGGTISITGGTVTANGGGGGGTGIGDGVNGAGGTITAITGNAIIFASSIQPELPTGGNLGPAIVFNGNSGNLYGNFTLWRNLTIDEDKTLAIPSDGRLTIGSYTLQNNGTINVESGGAINGTVSGNQPNQ